MTSNSTAVFDWSAVAPAWEEYAADTERSSSPVLAAVREALALQPGENVLELGAGTGAFARTLADQIGRTGTLLASDIAQGMVDIATRTLADLPGVQVRRLDAAATALPDEQFDAVAFVMGLMFLPAPEQGAGEIRRVLRSGGRAAVTVWAGPQANPWLSSLGMAAMANGLVSGGPPTGPGGLFSLAEPDHFEQALRHGGFQEVTVTPIPLEMRWTGPEAWFEQVSRLAGPLAAALTAQPDKVDGVRTTALQLVSAHETKDGLVLPGLAYLGFARKDA